MPSWSTEEVPELAQSVKAIAGWPAVTRTKFFQARGVGGADILDALIRMMDEHGFGWRCANAYSSAVGVKIVLICRTSYQPTLHRETASRIAAE